MVWHGKVWHGLQLHPTEKKSPDGNSSGLCCIQGHIRSQTRSQASGSLRTYLFAESVKSVQKPAHVDEFLSRVCAVREPGLDALLSRLNASRIA